MDFLNPLFMSLASGLIFLAEKKALFYLYGELASGM